MPKLGSSQIIDAPLVNAAPGLPIVPELTDHEFLVARTPDVGLWVDPANAPPSGSPLLREKRSGLKLARFAADKTTTLAPNIANGHPVIRFTGDNAQGVQVPADYVVPAAAYTLIAVVAIRDLTQAAVIVGDPTGTASPRLNFALQTGEGKAGIRIDHGNIGNDRLVVDAGAEGAGLPQDTFAVITASFDGATDSARLYMNETEVAASDTFYVDNPQEPGLHLGTINGNNTGAIDLAEFIVLHRSSHSDASGIASRIALTASLKAKFGIV
jgi:hypothetical protein